MEPLVVLAAELLAAALIAGALVLVAAAALAAALALRPRASAAAQLRRRLARAFAALFALALALLLLLPTLLLGPALRRVLADAAARTGYAVTFARADASLLRGALTLEGVVVDRPGVTHLDLERAHLDLSWPSLLAPRVTVEALEIAGLRGYYSPPERTGGPPRPRGRPFTVERLRLHGATLALPAAAGAATSGHRLVIDDLEVAPLRSDHAIEDLVFAAQGRLHLDALALTITRGDDASLWEVGDLPLADLHPYLPEAARALGGRLDLRVTAERFAGLRLLVRLRLRDLHAPGARPWVDRALALAPPLELTHELRVDAERLTGALALADTDLLQRLLGALARALTSRPATLGPTAEPSPE